MLPAVIADSRFPRPLPTNLNLSVAGPGSISRLLGSVAVGHVVASLESTAAVVAAEGVHEGVDRKSGPGGVALKQEMRAW